MSNASILCADTSFIAQSAFAQFPCAVGLDLSAEVIVRTPFSGIGEYLGTRAAIEAEGVIPVGTKWPDGFDAHHWSDDKFSYRLRRKRPEGIKGPRKQLLDMDWWMFRCEPLYLKPVSVSLIESKAKALKDEIYRHSSKGEAEWRKQWEARLAAEQDEKFQAFKALIPGIKRPKRGRRPKIANQSQGASA